MRTHLLSCISPVRWVFLFILPFMEVSVGGSFQITVSRQQVICFVVEPVGLLFGIANGAAAVQPQQEGVVGIGQQQGYGFFEERGLPVVQVQGANFGIRCAGARALGKGFLRHAFFFRGSSGGRSRRRSWASLAELAQAVADELRAVVDETGVDLYEVGAGIEFGLHVGGAHHTTDGDKRDTRQTGADFGEDGGRARGERCTGQPSLFAAARVAGDGAFIEGGVGGNDAVDAAGGDGVEQVVERVVIEVGGDFDDDGDVFLCGGGKALLFALDACQQGTQGSAVLQVAQAGGVG